MTFQPMHEHLVTCPDCGERMLTTGPSARLVHGDPHSVVVDSGAPAAPRSGDDDTDC